MAMAADYSFQLISIETFAPQYKRLNKSFLGSVDRFQSSFAIPLSKKPLDVKNQFSSSYCYSNEIEFCLEGCKYIYNVRQLCNAFYATFKISWSRHFLFVLIFDLYFILSGNVNPKKLSNGTGNEKPRHVYVILQQARKNCLF